METPGAALPFALIAAATGMPQPAVGAQERRVTLGAAPADSMLDTGAPAGSEQPGFATLLAHLQSPPGKHASAPQNPPDLVAATVLIESTHNVLDSAPESIATLPTQSHLATNELLPSAPVAAGGTLLPGTGKIAPPAGHETRTLGEAHHKVAQSQLTGRNQLPHARPKIPSSPVEDRSTLDRQVAGTLPRALTPPPVTATVVVDPSRGVVSSVEWPATQANVLEQLISASTFESAAERKSDDRSDATLIRAQPSEADRANYFQPTLTPLGSRVSLTNAPLIQSLDLNLPGDKAQWIEPLAKRVAWLIHKGTNTADLRLNPPHLGRVEIRISVQNDLASVWLSAANPEVREMLEQTLPRLDGLLESSGLELADAEITDERFPHFMAPNNPQSSIEDDDSSETVEPHRARQVLLGLIDTYV